MKPCQHGLEVDCECRGGIETIELSGPEGHIIEMQERKIQEFIAQQENIKAFLCNMTWEEFEEKYCRLVIDNALLLRAVKSAEDNMWVREGDDGEYKVCCCCGVSKRAKHSDCELFESIKACRDAGIKFE